MSEPREPSFYVGYLPNAPREVGRFVRLAVLAFAAVALVVAGLWAGSQRTWQPSAFEFGRVREFSGLYLHAPVPHLRVAQPGAEAGHARWLLVSQGKHGGDPAWAEFDGRSVQLLGTLAFRSEGTLIEVVGGSIAELAAAPTTPDGPQELGHVRLSGEIVDSKCWLGVMNPGSLRTHRACATLCIRGGIPPLLMVSTPESPARQVLLVGPDGEAVNMAVLPWVALPVELEGQLSRHDDLWVLRADPAAIRPLQE